MRHAADVEIHLDDMVRRGKSAIGRLLIPEHGIDEDIIWSLVPDCRSAGGECCPRVDDERQLFIVDLNGLGCVERLVPGFGDNHRNGFEVPIQFNTRNVTDVLSRPRWLASVFLRQLVTSGMPRFENYPPEVMDGLMSRTLKKTILKNDGMNWDDLRKLRELWPRTLMVKGVLSPQDAVKAAECGADAVIVSNHGGRNLDYSVAPIDALPGVVEAAGKRLTVIMDSGLRRGSDVVKALALGARAAFIGRAPLYGVAAHGEAGAARAIEIFREEISRVMALLGVNSVAELDRRCLQLPEMK